MVHRDDRPGNRRRLIAHRRLGADRRRFCRDLDQAWSDLVWNRAEHQAFDLLYVSYKEVKTGKRFVPISGSVFTPLGGLWHLSGYVLSRRGARKLLDAL